MKRIIIEQIQPGELNEEFGAKKADDPTTDIRYFGGIKLTENQNIVSGGVPRPAIVYFLYAPIYFNLEDGNKAQLTDTNERKYDFPIADSNLTLSQLVNLISLVNFPGGAGGTTVNGSNEVKVTGDGSGGNPYIISLIQGKYLDDSEASANGVDVGDVYRLKQGNPYGMTEDVLKVRTT